MTALSPGSLRSDSSPYSVGASRVEHSASRDVLIDRFGRRIDHLRLSVTDACDMRCCYCRPQSEGSARLPGHLTDEQRVELVTFLHARFGLSQIRLTGGEPLIYDGLIDLIQAIKRGLPSVSLALTTNARRLARFAGALRDVGIERINVSLDSINPKTFRAMTGVALGPVLEGLEAARAVGFPPARINSVVLRGMNDHELVALAAWGMERGHEVRFLEAMPIGPATDLNRRCFVSATEIRTALSSAFTLTPVPSPRGATATRYLAGGLGLSGVLGVIAPVTEPFCGSCRRGRVTADGKFFPCLLQDHHVDLRPAWRNADFDAARADALIRSAVQAKNEQGTIQPAAMIQLGG